MCCLVLVLRGKVSLQMMMMTMMVMMMVMMMMMIIIIGDGSGEESVEPVSGSWDVQGLEERRGYEARVQARNR